MNQRPTQTAAFWRNDFQITNDAADALYNCFVETGKPCSLNELGLFFVQKALEDEEKSLRTELAQGKIYQPNDNYAVGDTLIFTQFNYAVGTVTATRAGFHPTHGDFTVLAVEFAEHNGVATSFAADFSTPHTLTDAGSKIGINEDGSSLAAQLFDRYRAVIIPKIKKTLDANDNFIRFNHDWFLTDMLVDIQEGLLNIVDAAIDINAGPLDVTALIEQLELHNDNATPAATQFSVNVMLDKDERFLNVGLPGQPMWYLHRLKPPEISQPPHNLMVSEELVFDPDTLAPDMRALLNQIDDEATPAEFARPVDPDAAEVTFVLNYPHRRSGTLPVIPAVEALLPDTFDDRVLALQFVDGQTGVEMVGWYVRRHRYIFGFGDWFVEHQLPVGAFIVLKRTDNPLRFIIDYIPQRTMREWVRVAMVKNNQLVFEMRNRQLACRYDELMVIGEEGSAAIDTLWEKTTQNNTPISVLVDRIVPGLLKLTSQGTVHTNTLYSAINVARRCPPGPLLQELSNHPRCEWMWHGYWTFNISAE